LRPKHELAEILQLYQTDFLSKHTTNNQVLRTFGAIKACRTIKLGGHKKVCTNCGHLEISYNSCRNRHCPKCQAVARERWVKQREAELLNVAYFHIVFTVPHELNSLAKQYPKVFYDALFKSAWQTIQQFASDPKHLGAKTAMTAVLHTWGQQLSLHPHLHCIIPSGGLNEKGDWVLPKKYAKNKGKVKYLFPKKALSIVYRAKFLSCLREKINIPPPLAKAVIQKPWVVYAKQPFMGPKAVIEYLGRYTHKIAISNHRITQVGNHQVSFKYKDYSAGAKSKTMTLEATEFIRRFALHVLPHGFRRMRHYGMLASRNKSIDLNLAKDYFGLDRWRKQKITWQAIADEKLNIKPNQCAVCQSNSMITIQLIEPTRGPPLPKLKPKHNADNL
jgi:hypothetical protein